MRICTSAGSVIYRGVLQDGENKGGWTRNDGLCFCCTWNDQQSTCLRLFGSVARLPDRLLRLPDWHILFSEPVLQLHRDVEVENLLVVAGLLHEEVVVQDRSSRVFALFLRIPGKRIGR
jgi:hypothetical protein